MEQWLQERLSSCLNFPVPDDMISYVMSIRDPQEAEDYFKTLLDFDLPEHRTFISDFKMRSFKKANGNSSDNNGGAKKKLLPSQPRKNDKFKNSGEDEKENPSQKKKNKFTNLYTHDGKLTDVILLKGRHRCDCQAAKHKLINNCMQCGRIVCEQEGSGPCLFCGNLVCSEEESKLIESSSRKGENLKKSLMEQQRPKGWEEALAQRNRLLEYDRASEKRTTVIDDESDYFKSNSVWLSDTERKKLKRLEEEMMEKKHASRLQRKITIDFAGRQIIDEPQLTVEIEDEVLNEIAKSCIPTKSSKNDTKNRENMELELSDSIHPGIIGPPPIFDESVVTSIREKISGRKYDGVYNKVQDKELLEISDMRNCMSMHQPWASLLIAGIKKHEGRSWYTAHRGRLWIASTAKPVDMDEVKRMEQFYRNLYKDENIEFPSQYPSGCLLGCVSVQDCLPQEEYRKIYPDGESECPFVFICTSPQELPIRFPIKGMHKIYKLDPNIHVAAVKSLQRIAKIKAEES